MRPGYYRAITPFSLESELDRMMDCVAIGFAGHHIDFDLDYETYTWQPTDPDAADLLEDSEFPLVAMKYKQRFELYSDGTFAELARTGYDV